jgi:hypothetical protein
VLGREFGHPSGIERWRAYQRLEEGGGSGIDICARSADRRTAPLLGCQVERCGPGELLPTGGAPESGIDESNPAGWGKDHVLRFDVTMRYACLVTRYQRQQHVLKHNQCGFGA